MTNRIIIETDDPEQAVEIEGALHRAGVKETATEIREVEFDE